MPSSLESAKFKDVDLADPFFDSLKAQYGEFSDWFAKKSEESAYIVRDDVGNLRGFVYLKVETGEINDVNPPLPAARRIKVGTLKIIAHGTKLGERVIKKIFDHAFAEGAEEIYVTVFDTHAGLIKLFEKYGFTQKALKKTPNGVELVFARSLTQFTGDALEDYPFVHVEDKRFYLLAIFPKFHTDLFPDSMLKSEKTHIVEDLSHTNTIHKVYVAEFALTRLKKDDVIVIYRTTDIQGKARYRSVVTSVCVVEDAKSRRQFIDEDDFIRFTAPHSVFPEDELRDWYRDPARRLFAVKMTYNAAFPKRPIRDVLMDQVGISEQPRWDLRLITKAQFDDIIGLSELDERLIID